MKLSLFILGLFLFCNLGHAQDKKLDALAFQALLNDITLVSIDAERAVEQVFQKSGVTFTVDMETKAQSQGFWRIEGNKYCSKWPPSEHWSCYDVFSNDKIVVFVSSNGTRYQMRRPPAD
jgi:hypothetical protein